MAFHTKYSAALLLGAAVTALTSGHAFAQEAGTAPAAAAPETSSGTGEIIVTAQRRAERLEDVPVAITTFQAEELENSGVNGVLELAQATPGLNINRTGAYLQPTLRGISTSLTGPGAENNVAIYVDGFYVPTQVGSIFDFNSIASISVLKGPQGTLFGRNATGGAILVETLKPSFEPTGRFRASYGRFDDVRFNGYGSAGLSQTIAADFSVYVRRRDGYIKDLATGRGTNPVEQTNLRGKLLFKPNDLVEITFTAEHGEISDGTALDVTYPQNAIAAACFPPAVPFCQTVATAPNTSSLNIDPTVRAKTNAGYLSARVDLGWAKLSSYTSVRKDKNFVDTDLDGSYLPLYRATYRQNQRVITQEVNLSSDKGSLAWVLGAFYLEDKSSIPNFVQTGAFGRPTNHSKTTTEAFAIYADGTYELTERLAVTLGARYSTEKRGLNYRDDNPAVAPVSGSERFNSFTPRAAIRYELAPNTNIYASYSRGFKSGLFNSTAGQAAPVRPETIDAFEVGFKTAQRALRFDLSAYTYRYKDLQVQTLTFGSGGSISRFENAASADIYGGDAQLTWQPVEPLSLRAAVAYTHARFDSFPNAQTQRPNALGINGNVVVDASGVPLPRTPEWTANLGADFNTTIGAATLGLSGNLFWSDDVPFSVDRDLVTGRPRFVQDDYVLLNLRARLGLMDDRLGISAYGNNVTDTRYLTSNGPNALGDVFIYAEPATYGVSVELLF